MTPHEINHLAAYVALAAVVPALATTLIYGLGSPWWRSWLGRVVFTQWLAIVVVFAVVLLRRFLGNYPGSEWVALVSYSALFLAFTAMAVIVTLERRAPARARRQERLDTMADTTEGGQHAAITTATVPEIWFKAKRVVRTIVQGLIVIVPLANLLAAMVADYLNEQANLVVPAWVFVVLNGIVVATALLMGLVAKAMANPTVNTWLVKFGLGSVPAHAIESGQVR